MSRTLSDAGAAFTAEQEGAVPFWYLDRLGHWTIGIGHLWSGGTEFADVAVRGEDGIISSGRRLSDAEMWDLFRTDAARFVEAVDRLVTVELTQRQFDMLVDFAFNWGIGEVGGFPATSVLRLVNAGKFGAAAAELVDGRGPVTVDYPDGRPYDKGLAGVRRRRQLNAEPFQEVVVVKSPAQIIREAVDECIAAGRPVVWVPGCENRGRPYRFEPECVRIHHTATKGYANDYPSLGIVRDGRSDLPGPLSQFGLGRHTGTIYVVAFGYANDGGGGGWKGLSGNGSGFGIEAENDGIGEAWGAEITESYIVLVAALLRAMGRSAEWACRHAEWSNGGKIDTATAPFNNGNWIRARVAERLAAPTPSKEDELFSQSPIACTHLIAAHSGLFLTSTGDTHGSGVIQKRADGSLNQRWKIVGHEDGTVSYVNRAGDLALDRPDYKTDAGTFLQVARTEYNDAQRWSYDEVAPYLGRLWAPGTNRLLDIHMASREEGAGLQLWYGQHHWRHQQFVFATTI